MKKTKILIFLVAMGLMSGCLDSNKSSTSSTSSSTKKVAPITLTKEEVALLKDDTTNQGIAQLLVRKAVKKERDNTTLTKEQEEKLKELLENYELEYFIELQALKNVQVLDHEILEIYQNSSEEIQEADPTIVLPQIRESLYFSKIAQEKNKFVNSLIEKYKLNDELKKYAQDLPTEENATKDDTSKDKEAVTEIVDTVEQTTDID